MLQTFEQVKFARWVAKSEVIDQMLRSAAADQGYTLFAQVSLSKY